MDKYSKINIFLRRNSSTILTIIGSIGVATTAVVSARNTIKAVKRIDEKKVITTKEKIKVAAPCYIPTILVGASTILCICGAEKLNKNVQKSLTSAYVLLDQSYKEYRKSVNELYGKDSHTNVIQHMAEDKTNEMNIVDQDEYKIFFDFFSLRFYQLKMETVLEAESLANKMLNERGYVPLGAIYEVLGQGTCGNDDLLGWSTKAGELYGYDSIKISLHEITREDGSSYYVLDFMDPPTDDYIYL